MKENCVVITGADRGVGLALCREFLSAGWHVFAGIYLSYWKELDELLKNYSSQLTLVELNAADPESISQAAKQTAKITDRIDILIHCAGIFQGDTPENIHNQLAVNAVGAVNVTEAFLPLMLEGMKRLCFFSSEAGSIPLAHRTENMGYCMSKTALNMAVKLMFNELSHEGFTFRIYHPGWVRSYMAGDTKSTEGKFEPEETAKTAYEQFVSRRECETVLFMTDVNGHMWPF